MSVADVLRRVHDDALEAIQTARVAEFDDLTEAYIETLEAFPQAAAKYGPRVTSAVAGGARGLPIGPVDRVRQYLYEELKASLSAPSREIALRAAYVPLAVLQRVINMPADPVVDQMLDLFPAFYATARSDPGPHSDLIADRAINHLFEFMRWIVGGIAMAGNVAHAQWLTRKAYFRINESLRRAIDLEDEPMIERTVQQWREFRPMWVQIDRSEDDLVRLRQLFLLGLVMWGLRRARAAESAATFWKITLLLAGTFNDANEAFQVGEAAMSLDADDTMPWSSWLTSELAVDRVAYIPTQDELLRATVFIALYRAQPPLRIAPSEWIVQQQGDAKRVLDELVSLSRAWERADVDEETLARRREALGRAIDEAVEEERRLDIERVRAEELDEAKTRVFIAALDESWLHHRILPGMLKVAGTSPGESVVDNPVTLQHWLPKVWFVPSGRVIGLDFTGRDIGREIVRREMTVFMQLLEGTQPAPPFSGPLRARVDAARQDLIRNGYTPSLLLVPVAYQLLEQLGLSMLAGTRDWRVVSVVPDGALHWFHGYIDDIPVVAWPEVPDDRLWLIDAPAFCTWRAGRGTTVDAQLRAFAEEEAFAFAEQRPEAFSDPSAPVDVRANIVRDQVRLEATSKIEVAISDARAARWLEAPNVTPSEGITIEG